MEVPILSCLLWTTFLLSFTLVAAQDDCTEVKNCEKCSNPPQECTVCGPGKVLRPDGKGCDNCPTACGKCEYGDNGVVACSECYNSFNGQNYVLSDFGICESCSANCKECIVSVSGSTECTRCEDGFARNDKTKACSRCALGCAKCNLNNGVTVCTTAKEGYRLDSSVVTNIAECYANCAECDKTKCIKCVDDYYVAVDGTCQGCTSKCTECNKDECNVCHESYGPKSAPTCEACPANCERCDSGGCIECASGYAPDYGANYRQCYRCPQNCHTCIYTTVGTFCADDGCDDLFARNPTFGTCHRCDDNCLAACVWKTQLKDEFAYYYDSSLEITVDVNGPACINCKKGYGTTHHGQCAKCPDNCLACYDDTRAHEMVAEKNGIPRMSCYSSYDCGFEMGTDAYVINGKTYPKKWEINTDHVVIGGFDDLPTLNEGGIMVKPDEGSAIVDPDEGGFSGFSGFSGFPICGDSPCGVIPMPVKRAVLSDDDDMPYTAGFEKDDCCEFRYSYYLQDVFDDNGDKTHEIVLCGACPDHCVLCQNNDPQYCEQCEPGYGLNGDRTECLEAVPYCYDASTNSATDCDDCYPFHENADHRVNVKETAGIGECKKCPDNCLWSDDDVGVYNNENCMLNSNGEAECVTCRDYYGIIGGQCQRCDDKCVTCAWTDAATPVYSCSECDDRTVLVNNLECVDCPANCADCDNTDGSTCVDCDSGFIKDSDDLCIKCPDACVTSKEDCTYDGETQSTVCNSCDDGWIMKDGQCSECSENCVKCNLEDGNEICETCAQFYGLLDDGTCQQCPSDCATCSNGVCDVCSSRFFRNTEDCGYCGDGCETCTETSGSMTCTKCLHGYVIDTNKNCIACPNDCEACTLKGGDVVCTECQYGSLVNDREVCSSCEDVTGVRSCASCHRDGQTPVCNKCAKGYSLKDDASECISCVNLENCNGADDECADLGHVCSDCSHGFDLQNGQCGIRCVECAGGSGVCGSGLAYNESTFCPAGNCFTCAQCCATDMCNAVDISSTTVTMANTYLTIAAMLVTLLLLSMN